MTENTGAETDSYAQIASINLLEYLREDNRPTIVFAQNVSAGVSLGEGVATQWSLAYSNPAFNAFLISIRDPRISSVNVNSNYGAFLQEIERVKAGHFNFAGQSWRVRFFLNRWKIVFCEDELDEVSAASGTPEHELSGLTRPDPLEGVQISTGTASAALAMARGHSSSSSSISTTPKAVSRSPSMDSSLSRELDTKEVIDWTLSDTPDMSPYVRMFKRIDWASTPLGPMHEWPLLLRQAVVKMMSNPDPRLLLWGDDYIILYNESVVPIVGANHPNALGKPVSIAFGEELWSGIKPIAQLAYYHGKATKLSKMEVLLRRREDLAYEEECFFTYVFTPILGEDGKAAGVLDEIIEVTNETIAERRVRTIIKIAEHTAAAEDLKDVLRQILRALNDNSHDVPFAMLYSVKNSEGEEISSRSSETASQSNSSAPEKHCWLEGLVGIDEANPAAIKTFLLSEGSEGFAAECRKAWRRRMPVLLEGASMPAGLVQPISGRTPYTRAVVCAIQPVYGPNILGFLVLGLNARRPFNDAYKDYIRLLNDRINTCTAQVVLPKEQREAQAQTEEAALRHSTLTKQLLMRTQEAERSEANFMRVAHSAPFGMFVLKPDGSPSYLNDAFYELTGVRKADIEQRFAQNFWSRTVHPDDLEGVRNSWARMKAMRQPVVFEYRAMRPWSAVDKATNTEMTGDFWIRAIAYPEVETNDDTIIGMQGWLENISLSKYTAQMQAKRLEEALEHKRQSEAFIDMTSHEIRNPLSAIVLSADSVINVFKDKTHTKPTVLSKEEVDEAVSAAQTIILCANHQRKLCSDILTLSKLDADLLRISPEKVDPVVLAQKALRMYTAEFQSAEIEATLTIHESMKALDIGEVVVDPSRLLQVLINLLTNAIKFTKDRPCKEINVSISASLERPLSDIHGVAFISPRDTTRERQQTSLDREDLPTIYLQFAVEDTGRGLNDKEMEVLFQRFSQASPKTYGQYGGSGLGLFISRELTELQGGQIGVSSMAGKGSTFAFYITALKLPQDPRSPLLAGGHLPYMTSGPTDATTESMMPAIVASLLPGRNALPSLPTRTNSAPPLPTISTTSHQAVSLKPQAMHVLVVEDNIINQKIMAQQLRRQGCTVSVANHGLEALSFLKTTHFAKDLQLDGAPPDQEPKALSLILLDLEMPIMDGLTCIRHIRDMERGGELTGHVPVIAVTANARSEQIANALGHGMDLVVTKPFRIPDLLAQMISLISGTAASGSGLGYVEQRPIGLV